MKSSSGSSIQPMWPSSESCDLSTSLIEFLKDSLTEPLKDALDGVTGCYLKDALPPALDSVNAGLTACGYGCSIIKLHPLMTPFLS
jgi:hypothetical protein